MRRQVCNSFYRELRSQHFPNRYAAYLAKMGTHTHGHADARKALELAGILRNGCVHDDFLAHPELPSAPLRAFSYTQAGGAASCGQRPNAVFKCPDGYAGSYPCNLPRYGGYPDFTNRAGNPFSNKIVLMDEVQSPPCPPDPLPPVPTSQPGPSLPSQHRADIALPRVTGRLDSSRLPLLRCRDRPALAHVGALTLVAPPECSDAGCFMQMV